MTGEIQDEEIKRLTDLEEGNDDIKTLTDKHQFQKMVERVNMQEHKLSEVCMEKDRLALELSN